jgi:RimJ/RimL family protein N-acetyltransferase
VQPLRVVPAVLETPRLRLRAWSPLDGPGLLPILEANRSHLGPWIPPRVAAPAPLAELAARLSAFARDFEAARAFRFAMLKRDDDRLIGEADLFPRDAERRVPLAAADRVELGYWLDSIAVGQGYATEATQALLDLAATMSGIVQAEIRCESANAPSAAIPRRLGFTLSAEIMDDAVHDGQPPVPLQVWTRRLGAPGCGMLATP